MLIELSYCLSESAPKWPTNPNEKYYEVSSQQKGDVSTTSSVYHHMHNGTHFDSPRHFDPEGKTIEELPIEDFYYTNPLALFFDKEQGDRVKLMDVEPYMEQLQKADIVLLCTGYSKYRDADPEHFMTDFPCIGPDFAQFMRTELPGLKAVAIDTLSVDSAVSGEQEGFPAHHALLEISAQYPQRTLRIFEDVNINQLKGVSDIKAISAFPVRFSGLEAAPIAMVALV